MPTYKKNIGDGRNVGVVHFIDGIEIKIDDRVVYGEIILTLKEYFNEENK